MDFERDKKMNDFEKTENIKLLSETITLILNGENKRAQQNLEYVAHSLRKQESKRETQPTSPDFEKNLDNLMGALARSLGGTLTKIDLEGK